MNLPYVYDNGRGVIGGPTVEFKRSHVFQPEYGWARRPDSPEWHSVRFNAGENYYKPKCPAQPWIHSKGDGVLPIVPNVVFGPVCPHCSKLEQLDRQDEVE